MSGLIKICLIFNVFQPDHILFPLFSHTVQYMLHSTAKACMYMFKYLDIFQLILPNSALFVTKRAVSLQWRVIFVCIWKLLTGGWHPAQGW